MIAARPIVVDMPRAADQCIHCEARGVSVCSVVAVSELDRLASAATVLTIGAGQSFIREGDPGGFFYNVTAGMARLCKLLPDGRRQILGFAGPGHFLGLGATERYGFSAEALEPMRVCRFSRARLLGLLTDFPALERRLLEVASSELAAAQEQMLLLGRKTASERVASFLLARAAMAPACPARLPMRAATVALPMTRGDIADYLGLTIETVSRTLTRLRNDGLIAIPGPGEVELRNPAALERMAGGLTPPPAERGRAARS